MINSSHDFDLDCEMAKIPQCGQGRMKTGSKKNIIWLIMYKVLTLWMKIALNHPAVWFFISH